jgi:ribosome biogenesis GTPase
MSGSKRKRDGKKIRVEFKKNYATRSRAKRIDTHPDDADWLASERVSGKGQRSRKRTVIGDLAPDAQSGFAVNLGVDADTTLTGRVLRVHGLTTLVETSDGRQFECATRRLLKSLATDLRHVVVAGDRVVIQPATGQQAMIMRVEPRYGTLSRTIRGKQQIIVSNVDRLVVVVSAAQPALKPNLVDRFLISAEKARITPIVCINKIDLVDAADLQPTIGVWGQLGYRVVMTSAKTGQGIDSLRQFLSGCASVFAGQSGVGKSSLLNAIDPQLQLPVGDVSETTEKGRHTTTTATLLPMAGGYVVDTPGIRQFQLWDIIAEEVPALFREIRPLVNFCRFPDCTHRHEDGCAVKDAVADGQIDLRRYESYCVIFEENVASPKP